MMPQTVTFSSVHQATVASRSFVPSRAEQMTTPAGTFRGVISSVVTTRFGSTPPARVGMTTASARARAACTTLPSPGGVSPTPVPSSWFMALVTVRTEGPSMSSTPSKGSMSNHSADEPWGSASTSRTGPLPRRAATAARYTAVVVFPTPPLTLLTTMFIAPDPLASPMSGHTVPAVPDGRSRQEELAQSTANDEDSGDGHDHEVGRVAQQNPAPDAEVGGAAQHHSLVERRTADDQLEPTGVHRDRVEGRRE